MRVSLSQHARMEQRLVQSPQMIQAMQILQLSSLDLQQRVEQELLENPFLEEQEPGGNDEGGPDEGDADEGDAAPADDGRETEDTRLEGMLEVLERYESDFGDGRQRSRNNEEVDRKMEALRNTPQSYHSLGDALLEQTALLDLDERQHEIIQFLVYSLDSRGYLADPLEELAAASGIEGLTAEELHDVLTELRSATHPALGARDLREGLLLQIDALKLDAPLVRALVDEHLEDITTNRLPRIARATGATLDEVKHAIEVIRTLDPIPGRDFGTASAETIHPDVIVEEVEGEFEVRLTREGIPELRLSPWHRKLLKEAARGDSVRQWVRKRIESARWFIDALEQRQSTLLRISRAIFERQRQFLEHGVKALQPLRMLEIAEVAGVHISTVSRAVAGKYVQTPHGIHPLRFFFTGGTAIESGGVASQASIKQRVKELVEKEDSSDPLSDDRLAALLKKEDGITIARRTVTKYRKALDIPSSTQRKSF